MAVFGYGSLAFGVFIVIILLYHKKMNEITKKIVYFLLSTMVVALTVSMAGYFGGKMVYEYGIGIDAQ